MYIPLEITLKSVLLANIAFGTKKEDLFVANIACRQFYQITPPERKKEIACCFDFE